MKMYVLKLSDTPELSIPLFTIKNDAIPMRIYKIVHTMPKNICRRCKRRSCEGVVKKSCELRVKKTRSNRPCRG
ncbi:MAG: hypothetical protein L6V93_01235 [Clostridiales bacterium]|nr:MAG: hypothetical protein L6V93_01235 [Clostridiales bacterium]